MKEIQSVENRFKNGVLLSLAERVALSASKLAQDNGLNEEDAESILRLACEATRMTNYRGFGERTT